MNLGQYIGEQRMALELARDPRIGPVVKRPLVERDADGQLRALGISTKRVRSAIKADDGRVKPDGIRARLWALLEQVDAPMSTPQIARKLDLTTVQVSSNLTLMARIGRIGARMTRRYYIVGSKADPTPRSL